MKNTPLINNETISELSKLINELERIGKMVFKPGNSKHGRYLTSEQVCDALDIDDVTFDRWVKNGIIKPFKPNQFDRLDIDKLKKKITR